MNPFEKLFGKKVPQSPSAGTLSGGATGSTVLGVKNWRTTGAALIPFVIGLLRITQNLLLGEMPALDDLVLIAIGLQGFVSKDKNVTGVGAAATTDPKEPEPPVVVKQW